MPIPYVAPAPAQSAPIAYPTAGGYAIAPKSPAVSLIVSFFLPGVGSMINGDVGIGITILLLWLLAVFLDITVFGLIVGVPLGVAMWIWGMIDAHQGAQRWNRRHGIISRSEEHTSELQSPDHLVCRLLLEKKKKSVIFNRTTNKTLTRDAACEFSAAGTPLVA